MAVGIIYQVSRFCRSNIAFLQLPKLLKTKSIPVILYRNEFIYRLLHLLRIFLVDVEVKVENCIEAIKPRHAPDDMEVTYIETEESGSATSCEKEQDSECGECIHTYNGRPAISASGTPISYDINSVQFSVSNYYKRSDKNW